MNDLAEDRKAIKAVGGS